MTYEELQQKLVATNSLLFHARHHFFTQQRYNNQELAKVNEQHDLELRKKEKDRKRAIVNIYTLRTSIIDVNNSQDVFLQNMLCYYDSRKGGDIVSIERFHGDLAFRDEWYNDSRLKPTLKILTDTFEFDIWGKIYEVTRKSKGPILGIKTDA